MTLTPSTRRDTCGSRAGAACLYHWFAGAAFRRGRSRVVARDRIDAAAPRVEGAWQRAFARAAEAVGVEAARRLAERQAAPDDDDPFGALLGSEAEASRRKPTRPSQMYARAGEAIAEITEEDRADGWPCVACGSCRTDREPLGGGNLQTHKTETWGSKDAPDWVHSVSYGDDEIDHEDSEMQQVRAFTSHTCTSGTSTGHHPAQVSLLLL